MRKVALALVLLFSVIEIFTPANALVIDTPAIDAVLLRYEPVPAQPGEYLQVWINMQNIGLKEAKDLKVVLEPKYPFYLDSGENATREIQNLNGLSNAVVNYKLRVASDAVEGENELVIKYTTKGDPKIYEANFSITIRTLDANLDVTSVESDEVSPGGTTNLKIRLKNYADSSLRDITVKLGLSGSDFLPINSTAEKKIYMVESQEEAVAEFILLASPGAECQPYKVPINISYHDSTGVLYEKSDYLTLIVNSEPEVVVDVEESEILTSGQVGDITLNVVNKGLCGVKFLTVRMEENNYKIISPSEVYIGNLDSDDFDSVTFKIYSDTTSSSLPLKLSVEYKDDNNKVYVENKTVDLALYTNEELSRYQLVPGSDPTGIIILVLIIIAVGYWYFRKRKKK